MNIQPIAPLRGEALRQAIAQPASDVGVTLEPGLVQQLLADVGDEEPGVLPFMQETLFRLWKYADRFTISLDDYMHLVGEKSGQSGLHVAMAEHAEWVYRTVLTTDAERKIAQRIVLRLVQFGKGAPNTRRQQTIKELQKGIDEDDKFENVLTALTTNRLVTPTDTLQGAGPGLQTPRVDLAHEALIRGWPRLRQWLQELGPAEQIGRRLEEQAEDRERLRRIQPQSGLLDIVELSEADAWLQGPMAVMLPPSKDLQALIADSRAAIEQDRQQKEELVFLQRRVAELERQRLEKEAQERQQLRRDGKADGLFDAVELAEAEAWVQSNAAELGVSDELRTLITDSRIAIERDRQQKEELVQLRRRQAQLTQQRLEKQAQERQRLQRDGKAGGLLDAVELVEAEAWLQSDDAAEIGVSDKLRALIADSRAAIEQDRQQKEELVQLQRQQTEIARQRLEKEAQERQQLRRDGKAGWLFDAVELAEAEAWLQSNAAELGVSDELRTLITDSRIAIERDRQQREELVQLRRQVAELTRRRLEKQAQERQRLQRDGKAGGLLDAVELVEAEAWLQSDDAAEIGVSDKLRALIADSRAAIEQEQQSIGSRRPEVMAELSGVPLARLGAGLEDAFTVDRLRQMLQSGFEGELSLNLDAIVPVQGRTLHDICHDLVLWALRDQRVGLQGLLAAAVRCNPGTRSWRRCKMNGGGSRLRCRLALTQA